MKTSMESNDFIKCAVKYTNTRYYRRYYIYRTYCLDCISEDITQNILVV